MYYSTEIVIKRPYYTYEELCYFASFITDVVDLHGLYVAEAVTMVSLVLQRLAWMCHGQWNFTIITGKGLHSPDGIPRIKPAVMEWLKYHNIGYNVMEDNEGRLVVWMETVGF